MSNLSPSQRRRRLLLGCLIVLAVFVLLIVYLVQL